MMLGLGLNLEDGPVAVAGISPRLLDHHGQGICLNHEPELSGGFFGILEIGGIHKYPTL